MMYSSGAAFGLGFVMNASCARDGMRSREAPRPLDRREGGLVPRVGHSRLPLLRTAGVTFWRGGVYYTHKILVIPPNLSGT